MIERTMSLRLDPADPKNRDHVDSYKLWAYKVERPQPVRLGVTESVKEAPR